jgi:hypothetical protein
VVLIVANLHEAENIFVLDGDWVKSSLCSKVDELIISIVICRL